MRPGADPLRRPVERLRAGGADVRSERCFDLGIPVLGICYGMQLACEALGGSVENAPAREYGRGRCQVLAERELFAGLPDSMDVWMSHGDQVARVSTISCRWRRPPPARSRP